MMTRLNNIVLDAISEERTFSLKTGENEMEISYNDYSIIINYSLERKDFYEEGNRIGGGDDFYMNIESVYIINMNTDEESSVDVSKDVEDFILNHSKIEDTDF